tara:strand:- start:1384 stop:1812 length:429 start_codon:yes stop_codon:yes gene_type:complete
MIAELAVCNAAFAVIKEAISNGRELYDCANAATSYFDNKSAIAKKVAANGKSDMQAFMALEKLKEQEEWLREYMIYAGRADMYTDWLAFQSECKKSRAEAERQVAIKKRKQIEMLVQLLTIVGICAVVIPIFILAAIFFFNR